MYADKPFEKLTTDVTEFKIGDEKVYLSPVLDMFNGEIISYETIAVISFHFIFGSYSLCHGWDFTR